MLCLASLESRHDLHCHATRHIGEAEVTTGVFVGEDLVIEAEEMKDGGVKIVGAHLAFHGALPCFIRRAVAHAAFHASTSHPHGEARGVVAAAVAVALVIVGRAAELPSPK